MGFLHLGSLRSHSGTGDGPSPFTWMSLEVAPETAAASSRVAATIRISFFMGVLSSSYRDWGKLPQYRGIPGKRQGVFLQALAAKGGGLRCPFAGCGPVFRATGCDGGD